jgi:hypothetical protein
LTSVAAEKILGIVFIFAAALKAWDLEVFAFQIRYYHVLEDPGLLWAAAVASMAWESLLGVALVAGLRLKGWGFEVCHAEKDARRRTAPHDCVPECRGRPLRVRQNRVPPPGRRAQRVFPRGPACSRCVARPCPRQN